MKNVFLGFLVLAAGLATLLTAPEQAHSRVILKEKVTFYPVAGANGREIFRSMIKNGPRVGLRDDQHALATTEYDYDIRNVEVAIKDGRCVPTNLDVHVTVKYTYPRWSGNRSAKATTRQAWKKFNESVVWHEKQHVKIALEYAEEYQKVLKQTRLKVSENCERAPFLTRFGTMRAALKHNFRQRLFDRRDLRPGGRGYQAQMQLLEAQ